MKHAWQITAAVSLLWVGTVWAATGMAQIRGTTAGSPVTGTATLTDTPSGLHVSISVAHVAPGKHGLHIHEGSACGDAGKAAGGHFNPDGVPHGFLPTDGFTKAHAGDFGNIDVGADGTGSLDLTLPGLSLAGGKYNVAGHAVILHEKTDDFGQPTGNAGGRIGCGVISVTQ